MKQFSIYLIVFCLISTFGCKEHYRDYTRVKVVRPRGTIHLELFNRSANHLSKEFMVAVEQHCLKRLSREGFRITDKNPQYELSVYLSVDSAINEGAENFHKKGSTIMPGPFTHYYSWKSKGILIAMELRQRNRSGLVWQDFFDLYFFENYSRDLNRTKGVIKYMISGIRIE